MFKPKSRNAPKRLKYSQQAAQKLINQICDPESAIASGLERVPDGYSLRTALIGQKTDYNDWITDGTVPVANFIHVGHPSIEAMVAKKVVPVGTYNFSGNLLATTLNPSSTARFVIDYAYDALQSESDYTTWVMIPKLTISENLVFPAFSGSSEIKVALIATAVTAGSLLTLWVEYEDINGTVTVGSSPFPSLSTSVAIYSTTVGLPANQSLKGIYLTSDVTSQINIVWSDFRWQVAVATTTALGYIYYSVPCKDFLSLIPSSDRVRCIASSVLITDANSDLNQAGFMSVGQNYDGAEEIAMSTVDIASRRDGSTFKASEGAYSALYTLDDSDFYHMNLDEKQFRRIMDAALTLCAYNGPAGTATKNIRARFVSIYEFKSSRNQLFQIESLPYDPNVMAAVTSAFFSEPFLCSNDGHLANAKKFLSRGIAYMRNHGYGIADNIGNVIDFIDDSPLSYEPRVKAALTVAKRGVRAAKQILRK